METTSLVARRPRRTFFLILLVPLTAAIGWSSCWCWREYQQYRAEQGSFLNCESDHFCYAEGTVRDLSHLLKRSVTASDLANMPKDRFEFKCPESNLNYEWSGQKRDLTGEGIAAWDPMPHDAP